MSRPPIKAMEAIKNYCQNRKTCEGCPLRSKDRYYNECENPPCSWEISGSKMGSH